ncbi:inositol 1,4,5-trisphosphate receptor-interacting protein-like 1 [Lathamus discolor]|uniref:inositol 1,4,5-trisphosphate receptor-interacting protein-like 1 n=1 Tax=Lathamus discolor TaxID=678569 RepID=UPI0032B7345D
MAVTKLFVWVLHVVILKGASSVVAREPNETARDRMQQPLGLLNQERVWLLEEVERPSQEKSKGRSYVVWRTLLFALQHWQSGLIAGVLLLLSVGLYWWLRKRSHEEDSSSDEESSSSEEEAQQEAEEEAEEEEEESEGEDADGERDVGSYFARRIRWSVRKLHYESDLVFLLVGSLLHACRQRLSSSFFPVLEAAIGVGSAFECWSPCEDDAVYRLLVPLKAPRGHAFHLEAGTVGQMLADSCIRVEQVCTCMTEETVGDMLCFLHHPEEVLRKNQKPSLLHTLCTGPHLDVQKTALWFQDLLRSAWEFVPQSRRYRMKVLPSIRSCKLQLTHVSGRTLLVEIVFGVQQGDSDIFLSSQVIEAVCTPSTTWSLSFSVAEAKFFWLMAREVPHDSFHLNCLQLCTRMLMGTGFSSYAFKTVVMHLLTTMPLAGWRRTDFLLRLEDIMRYLRYCLEEKRLNHFFFDNETIPEEIILPPALQRAEPLNLLQNLAQDPAAHEQAMSEFRELQFRLRRELFNWH